MTFDIKQFQDPSQLNGKHIVIWGVGSFGGGLGSALFCQDAGARVTILELQKPAALKEAAALSSQHHWDWHIGDAQHPILEQADLIIASPAIPPKALPQDPKLLKRITSDLALFFALHRGKRLAITGTKGKSSAAQLAHKILGWPILGNSHHSVLKLLKEQGQEINVVLELSSFQLWHLRRQGFPPIVDCAILTNLDRDHLDWHSDLDDYHSSKHYLMEHAKKRIDPNQASVRLKQGYFIDSDGKQLAKCSPPFDEKPHLAQSACQVLAAAAYFACHPKAIQDGLDQCNGLAHRQEKVHQSGQLVFINDSAATTPIALLAALKSISQPAVFILGGHDKGGDFREVAAFIEQQQIACVLLGQAAAKLSAAGIHGPICEDLSAAMETAVQGLLPSNAGNIVLSPGCASFGQFRNYVERGERFTAFARMRWPS